MAILISVIGLTVVVALLDSAIRYAKVEKHALKPLNDQERALCARIVDRGVGHPWICRKAVDTGQCPCLPCARLDKEKRTVSAAAVRRSGTPAA